MSQNEKEFSAEERREIAVKAVNRLITDAEAKRLLGNKELAETNRGLHSRISSASTPYPKMATRAARVGTSRLGYSCRHSLTPNFTLLFTSPTYTVPALRLPSEFWSIMRTSMHSLFKPIVAVLCLVFALFFAAPNAYADSFLYSYQNGFEDFSWTTAAIPAVTMQTTVPAADLIAASGPLGRVTTSVILDLGGIGGTATFFTGCSHVAIESPDEGFTLADYSTPGFYTVFDASLRVTAAPTPEPSSLALMLAGVGLVFAMRRRWIGLATG